MRKVTATALTSVSLTVGVDAYTLKGKGDALVYAVDGSGNTHAGGVPGPAEAAVTPGR